MKKIVLIVGSLLVMLAIAATLVACSTAENSGTEQSATGGAAASDATKVVLGYWGGTCEAPIYVGYEKGFFAEAGLAPELLKITADVPPLIANDELDAFELTPDKFKPMEQGAEFKIIDSLHKGCIQGVTTKGSGIKSPADLEGKKVAAAQGSIPQIEIASQMVLAGKDPKKVEWLTFASAQLEEALNSGQVDAFAQYDPWADIAEKNGAVKFFSNTYDDGLKDTLCCFVGMSSRTLERDPSIAAKLSAGFKKAAEFIEANPEEAADIIIKGGYVPLEAEGGAADDAQTTNANDGAAKSADEMDMGSESGFTKAIMLKELTDYGWISGDKKTVDDSFYNIWMMINRAGAMEDAPKGKTALDKYIKEDLYKKMVAFQGA